MQPKDGIKSTEFWFTTVLPGVVSLLVLTGVIGTGSADVVAELGKDIIMGVLALVTFVTYIAKRTELKKAVIGLEADRALQLERLEMKDQPVG